MLSAIILAGGKSKRMGTDKTKLIYNNKTLLQHTIDLLLPFSTDIIISGNIRQHTGYPVIPDTIPDAGPLGGLYTCLRQINNKQAIVLPADMPLLTHHIIKYLIDSADYQKDVNIFKTNEQWQTLVGIYSKDILPLIQNQIQLKDYKLRHLLQKSSLNLIDGSKFVKQFINVNSPDQWRKLQE
jgi:molybdopterin-guanine dinucleotide biosynthesis protein A